MKDEWYVGDRKQSRREGGTQMNVWERERDRMEIIHYLFHVMIYVHDSCEI